MLEYDFSKHPDQGFDELTGEHGGYEMGVRGSSITYSFQLNHFFKLTNLSASICSNVSCW
jgi:hypothetical protein